MQQPARSHSHGPHWAISVSRQLLAAAAAASSGTTGHGQGEVRPTIWDEFALKDRVALVSGANRGLGLEMALVLIEAGARAVYCVLICLVRRVDDWSSISANARDQKAMWKI